MSGATLVFSPRTNAEVEQMFEASRKIRKMTALDFMNAVVASDQIDALGKAAVMRWFRGRMTG